MVNRSPGIQGDTNLTEGRPTKAMSLRTIARIAAITSPSMTTPGTTGLPGKCPAIEGWSIGIVTWLSCVTALSLGFPDQPQQSLPGQFPRFVPREPGHQAERSGQKHRIQDPAQSRLDLFGGFGRRDDKGHEPRDGAFAFLRQEEDPVLDPVDLDQLLVQIAEGGAMAADVDDVLAAPLQPERGAALHRDDVRKRNGIAKIRRQQDAAAGLLLEMETIQNLPGLPRDGPSRRQAAGLGEAVDLMDVGVETAFGLFRQGPR